MRDDTWRDRDPGTHFHYSNFDFNTLANVIEREAGVDVFEDFHRRIAAPIGMQDFRPRDGVHCHGSHGDSVDTRLFAYPFRMTARDAARFGLLHLRGGRRGTGRWSRRSGSGASCPGAPGSGPWTIGSGPPSISPPLGATPAPSGRSWTPAPNPTPGTLRLVGAPDRRGAGSRGGGGNPRYDHRHGARTRTSRRPEIGMIPRRNEISRRDALNLGAGAIAALAAGGGGDLRVSEAAGEARRRGQSPSSPERP